VPKGARLPSHSCGLGKFSFAWWLLLFFLRLRCSCLGRNRFFRFYNSSSVLLQTPRGPVPPANKQNHPFPPKRIGFFLVPATRGSGSFANSLQFSPLQFFPVFMIRDFFHQRPNQGFWFVVCCFPGSPRRELSPTGYLADFARTPVFFLGKGTPAFSNSLPPPPIHRLSEPDHPQPTSNGWAFSRASSFGRVLVCNRFSALFPRSSCIFAAPCCGQATAFPFPPGQT